MQIAVATITYQNSSLPPLLINYKSLTAIHHNLPNYFSTDSSVLKQTEPLLVDDTATNNILSEDKWQAEKSSMGHLSIAHPFLNILSNLVWGGHEPDRTYLCGGIFAGHGRCTAIQGREHRCGCHGKCLLTGVAVVTHRGGGVWVWSAGHYKGDDAISFIKRVTDDRKSCLNYFYQY